MTENRRLEYTWNRVSEEGMGRLPAPMQRYFRFAYILGTERIKTVQLRQGGYFRLRPDQKWMPIRARQRVDVGALEFTWIGKVRGIKAIDQYENGSGSLTVKLLGFIPVAKATGPEVDQGELLRLLGEGVWFPTLYLEDYVRWEEIDDYTALASIQVGDVRASVLFEFDTTGAITRMSARRYMEVDGDFVLRNWEISNFTYREFNGIKIPYTCDVIWKLPEGDFCYDRIEILDIAYNTP